jgi:hypothetical protein
MAGVILATHNFYFNVSRFNSLDHLLLSETIFDTALDRVYVLCVCVCVCMMISIIYQIMTLLLPRFVYKRSFWDLVIEFISHAHHGLRLMK